MRPTIQNQPPLPTARDKILKADLIQSLAYPHKNRGFLSSHTRNAAAIENIIISQCLKSPAQIRKIPINLKYFD